jgi:hypothetical protein
MKRKLLLKERELEDDQKRKSLDKDIYYDELRRKLESKEREYDEQMRKTERKEKELHLLEEEYKKRMNEMNEIYHSKVKEIEELRSVLHRKEKEVDDAKLVLYNKEKELHDKEKSLKAKEEKVLKLNKLSSLGVYSHPYSSSSSDSPNSSNSESTGSSGQLSDDSASSVITVDMKRLIDDWKSQTERAQAEAKTLQTRVEDLETEKQQEIDQLNRKHFKAYEEMKKKCDRLEEDNQSCLDELADTKARLVCSSSFVFFVCCCSPYSNSSSCLVLSASCRNLGRARSTSSASFAERSSSCGACKSVNWRRSWPTTLRRSKKKSNSRTT